MYKNRPSLTITAGVAALIREIETLDRISGSRVSPTVDSLPTVEKLEEPKAQPSAIEMSSEERTAAGVSNDVEW